MRRKGVRVTPWTLVQTMGRVELLFTKILKTAGKASPKEISKSFISRSSLSKVGT
jgi:hypothetical protein